MMRSFKHTYFNLQKLIEKNRNNIYSKGQSFRICEEDNSGLNKEFENFNYNVGHFNHGEGDKTTSTHAQCITTKKSIVYVLTLALIFIILLIIILKSHDTNSESPLIKIQPDCKYRKKNIHNAFNDLEDPSILQTFTRYNSKYFSIGNKNMGPDNQTVDQAVTFVYEKPVNYIPVESLRIFYYIDISKCEMIMDKVKTRINIEFLHMSIFRAHELGITDLVLPETSIYIQDIHDENEIIELVDEAKFYKITVHIMLNAQFSTREENSEHVPEKFLKKNIKDSYVVYNGKYLYDQENMEIENYIKINIDKYKKVGIYHFFLRENPRRVSTVDGITFSISKGINMDKLKIRINTIREVGDDIILFYCYSNTLEQNIIKKQRFLVEGGMHHLKNVEFEKLLIDEVFFYDVFHKTKEEKILMFDIYIKENKYVRMNVIVGIFFFSPITVMLYLKDASYCPFCINILSDKDRLPEEEKVIRERFIKIAVTKKTDPYFNSESELIETNFHFNGIHFAMRGKKSINTKTHSVVLYFFNSFGERKTVLLRDYIEIEENKTLKIIYDSENVTLTRMELYNQKLFINSFQLILVKVYD